MSDVIIVESPRQEIIVEAGARGLPGKLDYGFYPAGLLIDPAQIEILSIRAEVGVGTTEVYAVPPGKLAFISLITRANTGVAGNFSGLNARVNGNVVRVLQPAQSIAGGGGQSITSLTILLSHGDGLLVTSSLAGLVAYITGLLFPETVPVKMVAAANLSTAPTPFIECPAGYQVLPVSTSNGVPIIVHVIQPLIVNDSGVTTTISAYLVPNGETLGPQHLVVAAPVASGGNHALLTIPVNRMLPGDVLYLQSSSSNPGCWARKVYAQFPL